MPSDEEMPAKCQTLILGSAEQFKDALRASELKHWHIRKVLSQYWVFRGGTADALGLSSVPQGKN